MADKVLRPVEYSDETQELLRNSLLKLNARIGDLGPIENVKGCSFNYQIFVNERGAKAVTDNHTEVTFQPLFMFYSYFHTSHSAYVANSTKSCGVKIVGFLYPNFL